MRKSASSPAPSTLHRADFIPLLVHDLKAPLSAILLSTNLLASETLGPLEGQQRNLVQMIAKSCERIQRLLEDVADVARLEAGTALTLTVSTEAPGPLVAEAAAEIAQMAEEKRVTFDLAAAAASPSLRVDYQRVVRMLGTIMTLLLKFTASGERCALAVGDEGGRVRIAVEAPIDGPAADRLMAVLADTTDRLHQLGARNDLGWTVAGAVARAHGGALTVDRSPGKVSIGFSVEKAEGNEGA